ncbi:MAG: CHAT domain-containing protein [Burkholderiales bacterium]|nr:CHAT domain-containing protein [Burkholderiales bacterium]
MITVVLGVGFLQLSSALAQPVLAIVLSQSPAAVALGKGNYQGAYRLASEHLREARRAGLVEVDVLLEAAFASHAVGQSLRSYELLEELFAPGRQLTNTVRARALHLRSQVGPASKKTVERAGDLEEALKLHTAAGPSELSEALLAQISLAILLCDQAANMAAPLITSLHQQRDSNTHFSASDKRWVDIGLAQCMNTQGRHAAAERVLAPLWSQMEAVLGKMHPDRLYAGHQLGFALRRQEKMREASVVLTEVLEGRRAVLGNEHLLTVMTTTLLVRQLRDAKRFDEALELAKELDATVAKTEGSGSARHLSISNTVAEVLLAKGEPVGALTIQEPAYRRLTEIAPDGQAADDARFTLAQILARLGRHREAEELFEQANVQDQQKYPVGHPLRWAALNNVAVMRGERRDYLGQLAVLEHLDAQMSEELAPNNSSLISVQNNKAFTLLRLKRADEAAVILEQLVITLSKARAETDTQLLRARAQLASAYAAKGEHAKAIALHEKTRDLRANTLPPNHLELANSWHSLGFAFEQANRKQEALVAFDTAFRMRKERVGLAHPDTIRSVRAVAGLLAEMGELEKSEAVYRQGVEGTESLREYSYHADWLRQAEFADSVGQYKNYARVLAKLGRWKEAFGIVDLSKARTLREMTYRQVNIISSSLTPVELAELTRVERDVAELSSQLALSVARTPQQEAMQAVNSGSASAAGKLAQERDEKVRALATLRSTLEAKYGWPKVANELKAQTEDASKFLSPQSVFLSFSKLGDSLLVTMLEPNGAVSGGVTQREIPGITSSLRALRTLWSVPSGLTGVNAGSGQLPPMALWRLKEGGYALLDLSVPAPEEAEEELTVDGLVKFVSEMVQSLVPPATWGYRRLVISTDDELAAIPFEALTRQGQPIVATHDVVYAQSWSMFRLLKQRESIYAKLPRHDLLVFGNPVYGVGDHKGQAQTRGHVGIAGHPGPFRGANGQGLEYLRWGNLPGAAKEVEAVAKLFGLEPGRNLIVGHDASESRLREFQSTGELARYRMVLFAAHGYLDSGTPDRSSIVLTQHPRPSMPSSQNDGYITAAEWRAMSVRSDLIFLSACDTGLGQIVSGEGVIGLPLSMFAAGNQNTVLTLWPIYDDSSSAFVVRFFEKVKSGAVFSEALARTKREFATGAAGGAWTAPAYWAPFILYGH